MLRKFTSKLELRHVISVLVALSILGVIGTNAVLDSAAAEITVTEINEFSNENSTTKVKTKEDTVGDFLEEHNFEIGAHDTVSLDNKTPIADDTNIIIKRGKPITIVADNHIIMCSTTKTTVGEALLEAGYFPDEDDILSPSSETPISDNLNITITRVSNNTIVITEEIPNSVEYKDDPTLKAGTTKVVQEGYHGVCEVTVKIVANDGVEVLREEISRVVTKEPENKIIAKGTKKEAPKQAVPAKKSAGNINYSKKLTMTATGYTAFRSDGSRGKTASGRAAGYGIVAVDPKVIPLGTRVYVEGYGEAIAADTGGAIKGNKIDLCFEMSNAEIRQKFGRKTVTVYILD